MAIDEKTIGTEHPDYAIGLNNLAGLVRAQGCFEEAELLYHEAIQSVLDSFVEEHPNTKTFQANLDDLLAQKT